MEKLTQHHNHNRDKYRWKDFNVGLRFQINPSKVGELVAVGMIVDWDPNHHRHQMFLPFRALLTCAIQEQEMVRCVTNYNLQGSPISS